MSTLKVANIHFEATGTNRVEYVANNINFRTGGGNFTISVGGAESLNVNASSVMISGANILASVAAAATSANLTSAWGTANAALANTNATFAGNLTLGINQTLFVGNATVNTAISAGSITTNGVALDIGRNRIINGAMEIDQRNAGVTVTAPASGIYIMDRFKTNRNAAGIVADFSQSSTAPAGFKNSAKIIATTGAAPGASEILELSQTIEGYNFADLGTSGTGWVLSFWVYATVAGNYTIRFGANTNYYYLAGYTIVSANTWQKISIPMSSPAAGTPLTTTGVGLGIEWSFSSGSTYTGGTSAWSTGNGAYTSLSAYNTNAFLTTSNVVHITGVQVEIGTVATPFERRQYGQELALCQRYYEIVYCWFAQQECSNGNLFATTLPWLVQKRAAPTVTYVSGTLSYCSMTLYSSDAHSGSFYLFNNSGSNNNVALQNGLFTCVAEF